MRLTLILWCFSLGVAPLVQAQSHAVVDNKGTVQNVTSNTVTRATTPPASAVEADVWVDTTDPNNTIAYIWDGTAWVRITPVARVMAAGRVSADGTVPRPLFNATASRDNVGTYSITFTNPLPNADYVILVSLRYSNGANSDDFKVSYELQTSTGFRVQVGDNDNDAATARTDRDLQFTFIVIDF